jgi:hypothetical protein
VSAFKMYERLHRVLRLMDLTRRAREPETSPGGNDPIQKSIVRCLNRIALTRISRSPSGAALRNYEDYGATGLPVRVDTVAGAVDHPIG